MSYTLQALVADEAVISKAAPPDAVVVRLPQGKAMIPLSDEMREAHHISFLPLTDEGAAEVPDGITVIAEAIAKAGRVATWPPALSVRHAVQIRILFLRSTCLLGGGR